MGHGYQNFNDGERLQLNYQAQCDTTFTLDISNTEVIIC
jgi:hypothetical protein